jgi:ribosomal-protein-alanine N-acetyltransferase
MSGDPRPALLAHLHAASVPQPWTEQAFAEVLALDTTRCILAETQHNAPIGFVLAALVGEEAEILMLAVDPAVRRRGVARHLMQSIQIQAGKVFLEVAADNAPACRLYRSLGFIEAGVRAGYYPNGADGIMLVWTNPDHQAIFVASE